MFTHVLVIVVVVYSLSVEDMNIAGRNGVDFCTNDWFSVQSCVPEGGARLCGNESGTVCKRLTTKKTKTKAKKR